MKIKLKKRIALFLSLLMCLNIGLAFAEGNIEAKLEGQVELEKKEGQVEVKKEETGGANKEDREIEKQEEQEKKVEDLDIDEPEEEVKLDGRGLASEDEYENFDLEWFEYEEKNGNIILENLKADYRYIETIVIPSSIVMEDTGDSKSISIKNSGFFMSLKDSSVKKLIIKDRVKFNGEVMDSAFVSSKLEEVDLSGLDTSGVTSMNSMFSGCKNLKTLDLGNKFDTSKVTNMNYMFSGCENLTELNLGDNFNTSEVTEMVYMFLGCKNLKTLNLGNNFNTKNVEFMTAMFSGCETLKTLNLSNFDTSQVTDMVEMFLGCKNLKTLNLGNNFNTSKVTNMVHMFSGCETLKTLNLSNFDTSQVTDMVEMFSGCENLTELNLGDKFDTSKVGTMNNMFYNTPKLRYLDLSKLNLSRNKIKNSIFALPNKKKVPMLVVVNKDYLNDMKIFMKNRIPVGPRFNPGEGEFTSHGMESYEENGFRRIFNKILISNEDEALVELDVINNIIGLEPPVGKVFSHWEDEVGNRFDITGDIDVRENNNTYTAIYVEPITSHTVSFIVEGKATRVSVEDGEKIQQRDIPDTSRPGYSFLGWNTKEDGSGEDFDLASPIKSDLTLYASYRRKSSGGGGSSRPDKDKPGENKPEEKPDKPEEKPDKPAEKPSEVTPQKPSTPEEQNKVDRYKGGDRSEREDLIGMIIEDQIDYELNKTDHLAYLKGYKDDTVRPEGNVTREEAAMVFYRLMEPEFREEVETEDQDFTDVEAGRWSEKAIATLAKAEMITGYKDGSFKPTKEITRAEVSSMIGKLTDTIILPTDFKDIVEHWAEDYINSVEREGWIRGYEDGSFKPNALIKRSEFVTIVNSILERQVKKENILEGIKAFKDLGENKWYYEQVIEATNGHKYVIKDGEEVWTELDKREFE